MILDTAKATLLSPFDLEAGKLERVFAALGTRRIDYADLYFQYSRYEGWSLEEGIVVAELSRERIADVRRQLPALEHRLVF